MSTTEQLEQALAGSRRKALRVPRPVMIAGAVIVGAFVLLALASGLLRGPAYEQDLIARLQPPAYAEGGSWSHPLGTDSLGRDVAARIAVSIRISLSVAATAVLIAGIAGLALGVVAGYAGGWLDDMVMRLTDAAIAIPLVLLALTVIAVLGTDLRTLILVIAATQWMTYARTARAETLVIREQQYVVAARSLGASTTTILARHVLPHVLPSMLALATLNVSVVILLEAALSYLGLGVQLPDPSLGSMLSEGRQYITRANWLGIWPGVTLLVLVLGVNLLGDGLRAVFDPHARSARAS